MSHYRYDDEPRPPRRSLAGGWIGWLILGLIPVAILGSSFVPADYVIHQPGVVHDVLGTISVDGNPTPIIDIPAAQTYPTTGALDMLTVTAYGDPEYPVSWLSVAQAWLDPSQSIVPMDVAYPDGLTGNESREQNARLMKQSQDAAVAAALSATGIEYTTTVWVAGVTEGGPSVDLLEEGDHISAVNGTPVADGLSLRERIAESGADVPLTITVTRGGEAVEIPITPVMSTGDDARPIIGIETETRFEFPFEVSIELGNIGGPSAGQIFALAIIDKLTPGALIGDLAVAGTGTVSTTGAVGPIGGITQKLYAAERAGAKVFLAPLSNCGDIAAGAVPRGLDIYAVDSLADSLYVLNTLSSGGSSALLPRCPVQTPAQ